LLERIFATFAYTDYLTLVYSHPLVWIHFHQFLSMGYQPLKIPFSLLRKNRLRHL